MASITMSAEEHKARKARSQKLLLWFAMASMTMMFAGITSAFVVSKSREDWMKEFQMPSAFYLSTLAIILCSVTFHLAKKTIQKDDRKATSGFLLLTLGLGITFVFLSNSPRIDMRNIPIQAEYFAVLIDFEHEDFSELPKSPAPYKKYFQGDINPVLASALCQFMEFSSIAPAQVMRLRKREILEIIYHSGYKDVCNIVEPPSLSEKVQSMISNDISCDWPVDLIASNLFMSASTLRRKLKTEGNNIQDIRNRARLGYGLHLLQTTQFHIGNIAEQCGYQSQSRFTEQFKLLFGMTPREIRKTKMLD